MRRALVVACVAVLAACGGDDHVATSTETADAPEGELVYLLPDEDATTSTFPGPEEQGGGFAIVLGRPDGDAFVDLIAATTEITAADREVAPDEAATLEQVDVDGQVARLAREGPLGASVDWFDGDRLIAVLGPDADVLVDVARALDVEAGSLEEVPAGYEVIDRFAAEHMGPSPGWSVDLTEPAEPLSVDGQLVPAGFAPALVAGIGDRLERIEVRGHDAWVSTSSPTMEGLPDDFVLTNLAWLERPGTIVTIHGSAPLERILEIAASLREVSEEEFLSSS